MWKILLLSAFLAVVQAENIDTFVGNWWVLLVYPGAGLPICLKYSFAINPDTPQCDCTGGRNATFMIMKLEEGPKTGSSRPPQLLPIFPVDSSEEVEPLLEVTCRCGNEVYHFTAARRLGIKYFALYEKQHVPYYTLVDKNTVYVMGKTLPAMLDLLREAKDFGDLKYRNGVPICTTEIYDQYKKGIL